MPAVLQGVRRFSFGLTFEANGLRSRAELSRSK
jgi:hypothetical protein